MEFKVWFENTESPFLRNRRLNPDVQPMDLIKSGVQLRQLLKGLDDVQERVEIALKTGPKILDAFILIDGRPGQYFAYQIRRGNVPHENIGTFKTKEEAQKASLRYVGWNDRWIDFIFLKRSWV